MYEQERKTNSNGATWRVLVIFVEMRKKKKALLHRHDSHFIPVYNNKEAPTVIGLYR